ncbi:MAG: HAD-IIA family hydrolase [Anaerolineales bacterium]|nr:HAD-IIA family hydrolase [Anaerolineales bacterium]
MKLSKFKTILLDGDGVLWKSDQPLPGIKPFFSFLLGKKIRWALLTNNNMRTVQDYINKLSNFGISAEQNLIFTSSTTTAAYLLERFGAGTPLHVIGMDALKQTLLDAGFSLTTGEEMPENEVVAVVAGMDRQINHDKIKVAMRLIQGGAAFIATNTDGSYPTPEGINPGTGMVIGALQFTSGVKPFIAGKPHPAIFQSALKELDTNPGDTLMVGDRLETDILGANNLGIRTAAVLTGVTSREEIIRGNIKPDFIFEDITALHQALIEVYQS